MCKMGMELQNTVTCWKCGYATATLWSRKVRRDRDGSGSSAPFYSQLERRDCPSGAVVNSDGTVYLCAFCFALIDSNSNSSSSCSEDDPTFWKFVCGLCGISTYRKRVRALPLRKFQFLSESRIDGSLSITLGESDCAVVCLDCSETLWVQSDEYDRWGLPEHKRHFNWVTRPPPPENTEESNLARLPNGVAQLPRTTPTEPVIPSMLNLNNDVKMNEEQKIDVKVQNGQMRVKKVKVKNPRPHRSSSVSSSESSRSSNSNSNSNSSISTIIDHPVVKKKKISLQDNESSSLLCSVLMDQNSLPKIESLDLRTNKSSRNSSSKSPTWTFPHQNIIRSVNRKISLPTRPSFYHTSTPIAIPVKGQGRHNYHHHGQLFHDTSKHPYTFPKSNETLQFSYSSHHHHVPKSSVDIAVHQPHFNFNVVPPAHPTTTTESTYFRPFLTKIPNEPSQNTNNNLDVIQTCPSRRFSVPAMVQKSTSTAAVTLIPKKRKNWDFQHFNNTKEIDNPGIDIDIQLEERGSVVKYAN